ncbi:hypothetical protein CEXT_15671 [Caerostris extrusa]|uniref:Uncharacterized protein n=1 Tax=Caerostris extrusa TaxID=172846 RepID=A0AAV4MCY4_CAEEX|nr:hypothetical protein CEXT_15671 [Caerostris extrusa]
MSTLKLLPEPPRRGASNDSVGSFLFQQRWIRSVAQTTQMSFGSVSSLMGNNFIPISFIAFLPVAFPLIKISSAEKNA